MAAPVLLTHESSLRHDTGPHPERAARIVAIERELEARGGLGWERRGSPPPETGALLAARPGGDVPLVRGLGAARGGGGDARPGAAGGPPRGPRPPAGGGGGGG